jgi:RNA-directed DNA polymerase
MTLLDELAVHFQIGRGDLARFVQTAPARYKVYDIPKRSGGVRTIAQPSATLKKFQRYLIEEKLDVLPIHKAAAAYVKGRGIADNAQVHRGGRFLLKLDFTEFFPSITVADWRFTRHNYKQRFDPSDDWAYERLLFWGDGSIHPRRLSIGAPSSPMLSNVIMYSIDEMIFEEAQGRGINYSRYADDITISGPDRASILAFEKFVRLSVRRQVSPRLVFNDSKRGLFGPGQRRMVTGLIVTPSKNVSIGRDRKRLISAMLHRALNSQLDVIEIGHLKGLLGFCIAAEPEFVGRMRTKYGDRVVDAVLKSVTPKRTPGA